MGVVWWVGSTAWHLLVGASDPAGVKLAAGALVLLGPVSHLLAWRDLRGRKQDSWRHLGVAVTARHVVWRTALFTFLLWLPALPVFLLQGRGWWPALLAFEMTGAFLAIGVGTAALQVRFLLAAAEHDPPKPAVGWVRLGAAVVTWIYAAAHLVQEPGQSGFLLLTCLVLAGALLVLGLNRLDAYGPERLDRLQR
jgi:hypothetical protein